MTFAEFAIEYRAAFAAMIRYTPDQVGMNHFADKMADLYDAHPDWADAVEAGDDEPAGGSG